MKHIHIKAKFLKDELHDLGFSELQNDHYRTLRPDGSFNVSRAGKKNLSLQDVYNRLITMPWTDFNIWILIWFTVVNCLFASIYFAIGAEHLGGKTIGATPFEQFLDCFFFSVQTLSTVGYGHLSPNDYRASAVAAFECLMGLLGFAWATGLLYGRFSRPISNILFSKNMLVSPHQGARSLMFRIVNGRDKTQLIDTQVLVILSLMVEEDGIVARRFFELKLERKRTNFFPMSWTLIHPIDENSLLFGINEEMIEESDPEILISVNAFDEIYAQVVYARYSYTYKDLVWAARFLPMLNQESGLSIIELDKLDAYEYARLPELPGYTEAIH